jgi:Flp pilus assembly protein TadG
VKNKGTMIALLVVVFLATAGGSFWLGTYYETQNRMSRIRQFSNGMAPGQGQQRTAGQQGENGARRQGSMPITGKVDKVTSDTITITTRFGSQKINLTSKTAVNKAATGNFDDIKQGSQIFVTANGDSGEQIEAKSVQILSP